MRTNIESSWTQSLLRGEQPSAADLRDHLMTVHRNYPGFTESCALRCEDNLGRNSYEFLADIVDPSQHRRVLDLACGSGVLLEICNRRFGESVALHGLDMSIEELELARKRNSNPLIELHQGVAQNLGSFDDGIFDVVLCHWGLTLMDQVPQVLREVSRVLKPDGIFAAIVDGDPATAPGYAKIHNVIYNSVQREHPNYGKADLGDPRVRTSKDLKQLAFGSFKCAQVHIDSSVFDLYDMPDVLAREAAGFFYASFVLSTSAHNQMLRELEEFFAGRNKNEGSSFSLPVNRLVVRQRLTGEGQTL